MQLINRHLVRPSPPAMEASSSKNGSDKENAGSCVPPLAMPASGGARFGADLDASAAGSSPRLCRTPASGDRPQPPASKRRKLDANGKAKQDSFADVLERLQASGGPGGQSTSSSLSCFLVRASLLLDEA